MWKIFRYIIYICVIFAVFAAAYNIRTVLVVPKVEKYIYANTGRKVSIGNFSFNPLRLAITAENVTLGNNISAKEIVISLNPLKIIQNIRSPLNYISRVGLYGVAVSIPDSDYIPLVPASQDAPAAGFAFMLPRSGMDIFINDAVISRGGAKAEVSGGRLNLHRDGAEFSSAVSVRGITFNVSAQMNRKDGQIFDSSASITSNEFLESSINMSGQIDLSDLSFSQKVEADNVKFRAFETGYMSGMITRDSGSISGALDGEFGSVEIYYCAKDGFSATVKADLSKMNGDVKGLLDFKLKQAEEEGDIALKINDLSVFNFGLGSFCVTGVRRFNGDLEFSADYGNRNRLAGNYLRNGEYELNIMSADKLAGRLSGNFRKSTIDADIKNIDLAKMPVAPFLGDKAKGKLSVTGSINENSGKINMEILGLETPQIDKTDIFGLIARQGDINVFNFYKSDNSVVFNTVVQSGKVLSTDFKFLNTGLANVFRVFGYAQSGISGTANGRIKYERNGTTEFDIKAFDGVFFDNKFARLEAKGDVNLRRVNISYFLLKDETGAARMSVSGLLGFTGDTPASSLSINLKDIKAGPAVINTDASFSGTLNNKNEINGRFESKEINVSGVPFKNFYAASMMSVKKFEISDMTADNGLGGDFSADFVKKSLKGFLSLSDTDFSGINPALSGLITASVKVSGGFSAPSLTVSASVKKGAYAQIPFTLFSDIVFENGILNIKRTDFASGKAKMSLKGVYSSSSKDAVAVSFENLSESIINRFVGFRTPVIGEFSGAGAAGRRNNKMSLKISAAGTNTYVKNVKLDSFKSAIEVYGSKITVSSATAKIADSEIRAEKSSFDAATGKYELNMFLVNAHLGPADVFGNVTLSGKMNKKKGGSGYSGTVSMHNFWINRYKLSKMTLDYSILGRTLKIFRAPSKDNAASVSGSVIFADFPSIEGLKISKGGSSFSLNAVLNKEKLDIRSEGNNIDGEFLSELLDLPFDMGGSARIKMSAAGPLSSPDMLLSVGISGGSIMNIPFDTMDAEIVSSKNRAEIKKARVFKKNEIDVSVSGSFPLWLDSSLDKEMRKERVDVSYEIDDSKMNIIRYLSSEFFKPRAGKITAKGSIKGSPEKISNSGQLNVSGGYMDVENYFDKIKNFTADIAWKDNTVKINKFALKSGPGNFNLSGDIILKGFSVQSLNLKAATDNKGIFLKVPELPIPVSIFSRGIMQDFSNAEPRFDLSITGAPETPVISGWISLENARFTFPPPDGFGGASFLPEKTEFNVELRTAKNTKFENSYANAWINGKIKLTGPLDGIRAAGIIESQRGNVEYMGVNFDIISSKIEIVDDNKVFITMEGQTDVYYPGNNQPENIRMAIDRSELSSLNVRFFSKDDPTMDSQTALAKVTRTEQTQQSENTQLAGLSDFVLRQQALRLIDSSFATPLARTFLRRTRLVDNFRVSYVQQEPQDSSKTGSGEDMSFLSLFYGTKYSLEKNITNQLLLGYSITFDQFDKKLDLRHEIEMRYRLPWDLFLTGTYELQSDSYHQPDRKIMLEHQFRFGLPSLGTGNAKKTRSVEQK